MWLLLGLWVAALAGCRSQPVTETLAENASPVPTDSVAESTAAPFTATATSLVISTPTPEITFREFLDRLNDARLLRDPEGITELGLSDAYGYDDSTLTDLSPAYQLETIALAGEQLDMLHGWDYGSLSREDQISYLIYEWDLQDEMAREPYLLYDYPYNYLFGWHIDWFDLMTRYQPLDDPDDFKAYLSRLELFDEKVDQVLAFMDAQREAGIEPPRFMLEYARGQLASQATGTPQTNSLASRFRDALNAPTGLTEAGRQELLDDLSNTMSSVVFPAYSRLQDYLQQWQTGLASDHGLSALPGGEQAYASFLSHHTTTTMTAEEIHQLGLNEVARISAEIDALLVPLGITGGTMADVVGQVIAQSGVVQGEGNIVELYESILENAPQDFAGVFGTWPQTPLSVVPFSEPNAPGAYYLRAPADGSRPGEFYVNLASGQPYYSMPTLAYHEGVPGHHLQIALQQEIEGLPNFRKGVTFTAFAEGWALYAEFVAKEAGLYADDPYGDIGRLQGELFRSARLVVDTGLHEYGWTRPQAVDYMVETVGMPRQAMQAEVDRYLAWPGQATAYKIGMLKIQELRARAEQALGDDFDLIAFHDLIIRNGSVPLDVLEFLVDDWISSGGSS